MFDLHRLIKSFVPTRAKPYWWYLSDREYRSRINEQRAKFQEFSSSQSEAWELLFPQTNGQVVSGPFRGVRFPETFRSTQKLLGTYERELWHCFEDVQRQFIDKVIDIGAAEGFYVAGLSRLHADVPIVAFEADNRLHKSIEKIAAANGCVERVEILGRCESANLDAVLGMASIAFILCDIEGAEFHVLDPNQVPGLTNAIMLVEIHDHLVDGVGDALIARFEKSHSIDVINCASRRETDFPQNIELPESLRGAAMDEWRDERGKWFYMRPLALE